jgi:hypothetical protein
LLKFVFFLLAGLNALLLAANLGNLQAGPREPERLKKQLNAGQMRLIPAAAAQAAAATAQATVATAQAAKPSKPAEVSACTEIGNFALADARRFEAKVEDLELGERQSRHNVEGEEISSYIVFIPAQGGKEGLDQKTAELKQHGVSNYFVIGDNSPMRGAISLGVFKSEAGAQGLLASIVKQGVQGARVGPRFTSSKLVAFQFRQLDSATKARLDSIKTGFPDQAMRSCK